MKSIHDTRRDNLRELIADRFGGSQTKFAKEVGLQQPSFVSRLLTDREPTRKNIGHRLARRIESALALSPNWLDDPDADLNERGPRPRAVMAVMHLTEEELASGSAARARRRVLGVLEKMQAADQRVLLLSADDLGQCATLAVAYGPDSPAERITVHTDAAPPHALAMQLGDDSMAERFPVGSIVVIVDSKSPDANDFVVGVLPGEQAAAMRQWVEAADRRFLVPLNRAYQATEVTAEFRLLGVVVEAISFFPSTFRPTP